MLGPVKQYVRLLGAHLRPQWPKVVLLAVLLMFGAGLELLIPQLLRHFIDAALEGKAAQSLYATAIFLVIVGLSSEAIEVAGRYIGADVAWRATNRLRSDLALHVVGLDLSFHNARTPGELIERIDGDVGILSNFFSRFALSLVYGVILAMGVLVLLFLEDWRIGSAMAGFAVVFLLVHMRLQQIVHPLWQAERQASAELYGFLGERLPAVKDIQSSGASDYVMRRYFEMKLPQFFAELKAFVVFWATREGSEAIFTFAMGSAMALGIYLTQSDGITIGTVFLIFQYIRMLQWPLIMVSHEVQDLQRSRVSIQRVAELMATRSAVQDGHGMAMLTGVQRIQFDNVSFAYDPSQQVLQDVSFTLEAGRTLGLLGRTGSGKTTISRLLFRLYDTQGGSIRLGGVDIRDARLPELRRRVGLVTQEVQLFNASIRDNLTLFDPSIPDGRIEESIDLLGLSEWFQAQPSGLDTELVAGGSQLSAGEAQLLAFTRVFLRDPDVIVLDEASSRLDPATVTSRQVV